MEVRRVNIATGAVERFFNVGAPANCNSYLYLTVVGEPRGMTCSSAPSSEVLGGPCGATLAVEPPRIGNAYDVTVTAPAGNRVFVYRDEGTGLAPGVPCGRFVGSDAELVLSGMTNISGTFTRPLTIPASLSLCGSQFVFQALVGPPAAAGKIRSLSRTNGVRVTIVS